MSQISGVCETPKSIRLQRPHKRSADQVAATSQGQLLIQLEYRVRKTNQVGNLVFPFYFREGGRP